MRLIHSILRTIPKDDKLVLCGAWFGQKYIDNPKYVYEYLLKESDYKVFWITKNKNIYQKLKSENKPVLLFRSIDGIIKQIRAKAVFSTVQFSDYNQWLLTDTIYIDLGHGHPIKNPGKFLATPNIITLQNMLVKNLHFYGIKASSFAKEKYQDVVQVPSDNIFISDFARNDVFIDESLRKGKNVVVDSLKNGRKAIVYMPTHRSDGHKRLNIAEILPLQEIQNLCELNNWIFIIKKHFYHRTETENLDKFPNIFDITAIEDIDPQVLLFQADILITDYSACYIDYLLLNKPLMFYHFDIDSFIQHERSLYIPFDKIDIAPVAHNKEEFINHLAEIYSNEDEYIEKRAKFMPNYFDNTHQKDGRKKIKTILDQIMAQYS